jgi:membrane protein DedA with SNARE-associated domain
LFVSGGLREKALEKFILHYGLVAIFFGAGIEGEPFALAGGVLAHRHWLSPYAATFAAIGGSCLIDQLWFHLSRHFRQSRMVQSVVRRPAFDQAMKLVERHPVWFVLLFRFAYGLRAVAPVAIGASRVSARLFVPLNIVAAVVWGALFTGLGYTFGPTFEAAEARYGSGITVATVGLSVLVVFLAVRRGGR